MIKKEEYIYDLVEECEKLINDSINDHLLENIICDVKLRITRHETEEDMIYLTLIGLREYITDEIDYLNYMSCKDISEYEAELEEINKEHKSKLEEFRKRCIKEK